jgi:hypothetical protein
LEEVLEREVYTYAEDDASQRVQREQNVISCHV